MSGKELVYDDPKADPSTFSNNIDPLSGLNRLYNDPKVSDRGFEKVDYQQNEITEFQGKKITHISAETGPEKREVLPGVMKGYQFRKAGKDKYVEVTKRERSGMWGYKKKTYRIKKPKRLDDLMDFKAHQNRDKWC